MGIFMSGIKIYAKGTKFYRYEGDTLQIVRVNKYNKDTKHYYTFPIEGFDDKISTVTISVDESYNKWVRLVEDGIVSFSILKCEKKDVMIAVHTKEDKDIPCAICRQDVIDIFKMYSDTPENGKAWAGISVNRDNCPAEIKMEDFMLCDEIESTSVVAVYLDDTIDDILRCIDTTKMDNVLNKLADFRKDTNIIGNCRSVKELLEYHNFIYDFHNAFNVVEVPFPIMQESEVLLRDVIGQILHKVISNVFIIPYSKSIDTTEFAKPFMLMTPEWDRCKDEDKKIFIVGYDIDEDKDYLTVKYGTNNKEEIIKQLGFSTM